MPSRTSSVMGRDRASTPRTVSRRSRSREPSPMPPLAAQFASHGWEVIAVDVQQGVVDSINAGLSHVEAEPGLADLVSQAHAAGRLRATVDGTAAARGADVVVIIVPVMLDAGGRPDF